MRSLIKWLRDEWWWIQRCFVYRKVLRADCDWDWTALVCLMEFKLRLMAKHFRDCGHHVGSAQDAIDMERTAMALARMRNDYYLMSDYHPDNWRIGWTDKQWGDPLMLDRERFYRDPRTGMFRDGRATHENTMYQQDWEYVVKKMRKLRNWWD